MHGNSNMSVWWCSVGACSLLGGSDGGQFCGVILPIDQDGIALIRSSCSSVVGLSFSRLVSPSTTNFKPSYSFKCCLKIPSYFSPTLSELWAVASPGPLSHDGHNIAGRLCPRTRHLGRIQLQRGIEWSSEQWNEFFSQDQGRWYVQWPAAQQQPHR